MNKEIKKWLKSKNHNYDSGVRLYAKYGRNKNLNRYFNHDESVARKEKLIYELSKIAEVDPPAPTKPAPAPKPPQARTILGGTPKEIVMSGGHKTPFNLLPLIIQEVIKEKGKIYREREQLHEKLKKVFNDNKPANVKTREQISTHINHISKRIDELYNHQLAYEKSKKLPDESVLNWDPKPSTKSDKNKELMPDHSKMSDIDLKNRLTNLRTYITRDENQLKFQSRKKEEKANPMADGPKKNKIIKKIALRKAEINEIDAVLKKRQKKGSK